MNPRAVGAWRRRIVVYYCCSMQTKSLNIPVEVSARHVHLTQEDWTALFGSAEMTIGRPISQHPQFSAKERVTLRGPKGELQGVAIVGPVRSYTQAELAMTDAKRLGVMPPLSDSGHLDQAVEVTIAGPKGEIKRAAAIIQQRHLHVSPTEAADLHLHNGQVVSMMIGTQRRVKFDQVLVRVHPKYSLRVHLDTDEANACGYTSDMIGEIIV